MSNEAFDQSIQEAHASIKAAQKAIDQAQGSDEDVIEQAQKQLFKAEQTLQGVQASAGSFANENPQFQQAFEQLHNARGDIQELQQNQ
ncbi:hypothetical protein [Lentibacillus saliphilus]|uniref:hypothetical protein n=1 Tax=Lentibacillus saliphilus TaxID=2737028 RepID=UPI001FE50F4C|nr:hypothetical protein [Lentibacillus saliphilus]